MDVKIEGLENNLNALLHLTVQNSIMLKALSSVLIEILAKDDEDADDNIRILNAQLVLSQEEVLTNLKVLFGDMDLGDLFPPEKNA